MQDEQVGKETVMSEKDILARIRKRPYSLKEFDMTEAHCLAAVKANGLVLRLIRKSLQTTAICKAAVKQNGLALQHVSPKLLTLTMCVEAVKKDADAIRFVPESMRSVTKTILAVPSNGRRLGLVPAEKRTAALCAAAVANHPLALEFVPNRYKTEKLCAAAVEKDWRAIQFIQQPEYDRESAIALLERIIDSEHSDDVNAVCNLVGRWPEDLLADMCIVRMLRKLRAREFVLKAYEKQTGLFRTEEEIRYAGEKDEREFNTFDELYAHVDGDLQGAELHDFDFPGIGLSRYNIAGAYINSSVLVAQGLYDDSCYVNAVCGLDDTHGSDMQMIEGTPAHLILHDQDLWWGTCDHQRRIFYVSDIHLNHRIQKAFPQHATELEIRRYIKDLVETMCSSMEPDYSDYLLIAGDVSFNMAIARVFYEYLVESLRSTRLSTRHVIVVLGNHEVWDWTAASDKPVRDLNGVVDEYRRMCHELGLCFLHNDLFILHRNYEPRILREEELRAISSDALRRLCLRSSLMILGGLGFSGLEPLHNAEAGLYRQNLTTLEEDVRQSRRFEELYLKMRDAAGDMKVIILTHTPRANWTREACNPCWIYVSGHTHRNEFCCNEEKTFYADNQIGYDGANPVYLKAFRTEMTYDIFRDYPDGIYQISREEYIDFNHGKNIKCDFNRTNGQIHMLKRNGIYCFIFCNSNTKALSLLNGGQLRRLHDRSLEHYYKRMIRYYHAVEELFAKYHRTLDYISECVRRIGGTGIIHGCIVDIDRIRWGEVCSHIAVNPNDGKLMFYAARSIVEKWEYKSLEALLKDRNPALYANYQQLLLDGNPNALTTRTDIACDEIAEFVPDTDMYARNRIVRAIQYMRDCNVIRIWNESILEEDETQKRAGCGRGVILLDD